MSPLARIAVTVVCVWVVLISATKIWRMSLEPGAGGLASPRPSQEQIDADRRKAAVESLNAASKNLQDSVRERAQRGELAETDEEKTAAVLQRLDETEAAIVGDSPWAKADRVSVGMTRDMMKLGNTIAKQNRELAAAGGLEILKDDTPETLKPRLALLQTLRGTQSEMVKLLSTLREELPGRMKAAGVDETTGARAVNSFLSGVGTGPALEFQLANERFLEQAHLVLSMLIESPGWTPDGQGGATYPDMDRQARFTTLWTTWDTLLQEMAQRQREMLGVEVGTPQEAPAQDSDPAVPTGGTR